MNCADFYVDLIPAPCDELGRPQAMAVSRHDEQGITLGKSSASTARRRDHALYLVWRQVFTAPAGVVWLARPAVAFGALPKMMFGASR